MQKIISLILSFIIGFFTYPISFLPDNTDSTFDVATGSFSQSEMQLNGNIAEIEITGGTVTDGYLYFSEKVTLEFSGTDTDWFNYFALAYESDSYVKGEISYRAGVKDKSEEFFLAPSDTVFYSFIDNILNGVKANALYSVSFEPLNNDSAKIKILGLSLFNREIPEQEIYIENEYHKIGIDLLWGGAMSYMENLTDNVETVTVDGYTRVDSDAGERYGTRVVDDSVNLINRYDTGRLVQQSYYGTSGGGYECGEFMGNVWGYNPVQGGNQFNESSKIVDLKVEENSIYIKCRPLDWAKSKEHITPSYMEATYSLDGELVHVSCRFVDFSGYMPVITSQEIPAFYCIEPFNRFVYYSGNEPWSNGELTYENDLIFWPDAGYPHFYNQENWGAFIGEFDDSFGIGVYVPDETEFLVGVFERETTTSTDPSTAAQTSYIAVTKTMLFQSFSPFEYDYYLTSGNTTEIRNNFGAIAS